MREEIIELSQDAEQIVHCVLALQTREQHIKTKKQPKIFTAQVLLSVMVSFCCISRSLRAYVYY
jgi:glycine cleavage system pyridoxal-binding protein P